jgi:hypothetical protein
MTFSETRPVTVLAEGIPLNVQWGPVIAGAITAAAVALVLHGFAAAIGLAVSSTAPTWRDASLALVLLSGLYLLLAAAVSYGFGAYVAGRLRSRTGAAATDEIEYRDGMHGLLVWALATLLAALLALAAAQTVPQLAAPSGGSGPQASVAGENIIAFDLDRLFRAERRAPQGDTTQLRAEAARILLTSSSHRGILPDDRAYLVRLVAAETGLTPPEAERRVNDVAARAKDNIDRARHSAVLLAFMAAAAALIGAAVAWFAACAAGRHREGLTPVPGLWNWTSDYDYRARRPIP